MSTVNVVSDSIEDMLTLLRAVPTYAQRVHHISSEQELIDKTKSLSFPQIGVLYEGLRPTKNSEGGSSTSSAGVSKIVSSDLNVAVLMFFRNEALSAEDTKLKFITEVDTLRRAVLGKVGPGGHAWRFIVEAYVAGKDGRLAIVQRWSTAVQLR